MAGILEDFQSIKTPDQVTLEGNAALESEVVLSALRESCESDEDWAALMSDAAVEMALYGVIDNAEVATEVTKRIVIQDYKSANFNRIEKRTAIRLAMINNDQLYSRYKKYRDLFLDARGKIYKKYGARARVEAKKIIRNARRKAANMPSAAGQTVVDKLDKQIAKVTDGPKTDDKD